MTLGEESLGNTLLHDDFHELGVVFEAFLTDVFEGVQDLLDFVLQDSLELALGHTVSVEDDGLGVAAVETVIVSQGAFHQRTDDVHNFDLLALGLLDEGHVLGDLLVHGGDETDRGHLAGLVMDVSTDDHGVGGQSLGLGGMPDGKSHLDVHLENDAAHRRQPFL